MSTLHQPSVHRRPGQSWWDRLREIDGILAARSTVTDAKRAEVRQWLASAPLSAAPRRPS